MGFLRYYIRNNDKGIMFTFFVLILSNTMNEFQFLFK